MLSFSYCCFYAVIFILFFHVAVFRHLSLCAQRLLIMRRARAWLMPYFFIRMSAAGLPMMFFPNVKGPARMSVQGLFVTIFFLYAKVITVPVLPSKASIALSREVMIAFLSGYALTNFIAASTFGSMLPGAN